jgi:hypothetical protein
LVFQARIITLVVCYSFSGAKRPLARFGTPQCPAQPNDRRDDTSDKHPNSFICRRSGEEPGDVGIEGIHGVDAKDDKHNTARDQGQRNHFVHNILPTVIWNFKITGASDCNSTPLPPGDEVDEDHDDGNHQQDVDQAAHGRTGDQAEEPKNY